MAWLKRGLASVLALLVAFVAIFSVGRRHERARQEARDAETYRETKERIDEVDGLRSVDAARGWLHERQSKRDL